MFFLAPTRATTWVELGEKVHPHDSMHPIGGINSHAFTLEPLIGAA
jgi:hypothetical protein